MFSSSGLVLLKLGTEKGVEISFGEGLLNIHINLIFFIGMCLYVASFITSLIIMKNMDLKIFYPVSAGLVYILVCLLSRFILHEEITFIQLVGMSVILLGIILLNIKN